MVLTGDERIQAGRDIAKMYEENKYTFEEIAEVYPFSASTVARIYQEHLERRAKGLELDTNPPTFWEKVVNWIKSFPK